MKKLNILLLVIASFVACKSKTSSNDDVQSIKFKFTELGRETQFRITCDKFDYYFPEGKEKTLTKSRELIVLCNC
ncbi:hypothetical protein ACQ86K_07090 [Mucilaginibacter sp. P19]|uniref:hypothetical protein n=1 Tax=Mucilaginibacter sp. P19 TaxID=3423947 RepID=UPI003D67AA5F